MPTTTENTCEVISIMKEMVTAQDLITALDNASCDIAPKARIEGMGAKEYIKGAERAALDRKDMLRDQLSFARCRSMQGAMFLLAGALHEADTVLSWAEGLTGNSFLRKAAEARGCRMRTEALRFLVKSVATDNAPNAKAVTEMLGLAPQSGIPPYDIRAPGLIEAAANAVQD